MYLMTFESENCLVSGDVDRGVVKSPPKSPSMPGWWEVGPNFDRCISKVFDQVVLLGEVHQAPPNQRLYCET